MQKTLATMDKQIAWLNHKMAEAKIQIGVHYIIYIVIYWIVFKENYINTYI